MIVNKAIFQTNVDVVVNQAAEVRNRLELVKEHDIESQKCRISTYVHMYLYPLPPLYPTQSCPTQEGTASAGLQRRQDSGQRAGGPGGQTGLATPLV